MDHSVVNILGKGQGWERIEYQKEGIIYGCNDAFLRTPEVAITFHMHDLEEYYHDEARGSSTRLCVDAANENPNMEFYTIYKWDRIPHSKEFPLDEIIKEFGVCYFTSTIEYMIAYAIWKGAKKLNYFGVNMTVEQEYIEQKPGVEFWTGIAMGRGIEVNLQHDVTSLLKTKSGELYGYFKPQWIPEQEEK